MKITSFAVIALLLITVTSISQTIKQKSIYAKQMTYEIGGDIMINSTEHVFGQTSITNESQSTRTTSLIINGSAGIFAVDWLKLAIEPAIEFDYPEHGSSKKILKIYFSPEYVLNLRSNIYPYLGAAAGYTSISYSNIDYPVQGGFSWGLKGGIKINAFGNALINVGVSYYRETFNYTNYFGDFKEHYNILGIRTGFAVFFR